MVNRTRSQIPKCNDYRKKEGGGQTMMFIDIMN